MKFEAKEQYLKSAEPVQSEQGDNINPQSSPFESIRDRALTQWGQSVSQANQLFMAWLEALGTSSTGLSDEYIALKKEQPKD